MSVDFLYAEASLSEGSIDLRGTSHDFVHNGFFNSHRTNYSYGWFETSEYNHLIDIFFYSHLISHISRSTNSSPLHFPRDVLQMYWILVLLNKIRNYPAQSHAIDYQPRLNNPHDRSCHCCQSSPRDKLSWLFACGVGINSFWNTIYPT